MSVSKSLPARPSLEALRKKPKKLARDIAAGDAGDAGAIARARAQLPNVDLRVTQRNAQLVIAREYGYAGWQDLTSVQRHGRHRSTTGSAGVIGHSTRNVLAGSTNAARRAGTHVAADATAINTSAITTPMR